MRSLPVSGANPARRHPRLAPVAALAPLALAAAVALAACGGALATPTPIPTAQPSASAGPGAAGLPPSLPVSSASAAPTPSAVPTDLTVLRDTVSYTPAVRCAALGISTTCHLSMDVVAPVVGGPWPVIVILPGGPASPSATDYLDGLAAALARRGAVAIVAKWRQAPEFGGGFPTTFADIGCAIGTARRLAPAYRGDPGTVTLVGHSLGAWGAAVVALTPTSFQPDSSACGATSGSLRPDALVDLSGAVDFLTGSYDDVDTPESFAGGDRGAQPAVWSATDPFALLAQLPIADRMPVLVVHGESDTSVSPDVSRRFEAALESAGFQSRLQIVPGGHTDLLDDPSVADSIVALARSIPQGMSPSPTG